MTRSSIIIFALCVTAATLPAFSLAPNKARSVYYPPPGNAWQKRTPEDAGMDSALLDQSVAYAMTQPGPMPADFSTQVETFGRVLGPLPKVHGDTNGIIIRHGYIVARVGRHEQDRSGL